MIKQAETLTTRETLKKYDKQRIRFKGTIDSFKNQAHHRVLVCLTDVTINELTFDHIWINLQQEWFVARADLVHFKQSTLSGTAEVASYVRRPKMLYSDQRNTLRSIASSVDYGIRDIKKMEIEG